MRVLILILCLACLGSISLANGIEDYQNYSGLFNSQESQSLKSNKNGSNQLGSGIKIFGGKCASEDGQEISLFTKVYGPGIKTYGGYLKDIYFFVYSDSRKAVTKKSIEVDKDSKDRNGFDPFEPLTLYYDHDNKVTQDYATGFFNGEDYADVIFRWNRGRLVVKIEPYSLYTEKCYCLLSK